MSARERILTIRLLEKAAMHPTYAQALGVELPAEGIPCAPGLPDQAANKENMME